MTTTDKTERQLTLVDVVHRLYKIQDRIETLREEVGKLRGDLKETDEWKQFEEAYIAERGMKR